MTVRNPETFSLLAGSFFRHKALKLFNVSKNTAKLLYALQATSQRVSVITNCRF
jgi:hypothetical protein